MIMYFLGAAVTSTVGFVLYGQVLMQALVLFVTIAGNKGRLVFGNRFYLGFMLLILLQGLVVGSIRLVYLENSIEDFMQYSLLWALGILGFCVGATVAQSKDFQAVTKLFASLAFVELGAVFYRLNLGFNSRSSVGFTFLLPFISQYVVQRRRFDYVSALTILSLLGVSLYVVLFSGQRSVFVIGILLIIISGVVLWRSRSRSVHNVGTQNVVGLRLYVAIMVVVLLGMAVLTYDYWINSFEVIVKRFSQSLFSPDSFRVDPNGGRIEEAQIALDAFFQSTFWFKEIFGLGFGFVFLENNEYVSAWRAHAHITPVAYFARFGIAGVLFWISLFFVPILRWQAVRRSKVQFWVVSVYYIFLASSLFAGFLNLPVFWVLMGYISSVRSDLRGDQKRGSIEESRLAYGRNK